MSKAACQRKAQLPVRAVPQRGAATLVVVLMLFFVVALVAAYTSRNLIFEQRTSVNQYRSTMSFEAAEAGIEWATALLNSGRIGDDCKEDSAVAGSTSFRQRYLDIHPSTGVIAPRTQAGGAPLSPTCIWNGVDSWNCSCPSNGNPVLPAPAGNQLQPAFRVRFDENTGRAGVIRVQVNACVRYEENCLNDFTSLPQPSEGRAQHNALLGLKPAVFSLPAAALTVFGSVTGGGAATLRNADADAAGLTLHSAGPANAASFTLQSTPGTPGGLSIRESDASLIPTGLTLADLQLPVIAANRERVFGSVFGLLPNGYRNQPAAIRYTCPASGCRAAVANLVARNPHRVIWISGDLVLESAGDIGSLPDPATPAVAGPAVLVVEGGVNFQVANVNIFGVVHARNGNWLGNGLIEGAALVEGDLAASAAPTINYNKAVLNASRLSSGSFVMLNGSWRDFKND